MMGDPQDLTPHSDSLLQRLDPRTKILATLVLVVAVVSTPPGLWQRFGLYFALIGVMLMLARVPLRYTLKRSIVAVPFVAVIAISVPFFKEGQVVASFAVGTAEITITHQGIVAFGSILVRAWLSLLSVIVLSATSFPEVLQGLAQLRVPRIMVTLLSLMHRYSLLLSEELAKMRRARDCRNLGGGRALQLRTTGNIIGTLFLRSYERGERVYAAMLSRGYDGEARRLSAHRFGARDLYFSIAFLGSLAAIWLLPNIC